MALRSHHRRSLACYLWGKYARRRGSACRWLVSSKQGRLKVRIQISGAPEVRNAARLGHLVNLPTQAGTLVIVQRGISQCWGRDGVFFCTKHIV